eukprot:758999-Hanusia_phi.AAC.1
MRVHRVGVVSASIGRRIEHHCAARQPEHGFSLHQKITSGWARCCSGPWLPAPPTHCHFRVTESSEPAGTHYAGLSCAPEVVIIVCRMQLVLNGPPSPQYLPRVRVTVTQALESDRQYDRIGLGGPSGESPRGPGPGPRGSAHCQRPPNPSLRQT